MVPPPSARLLLICRNGSKERNKAVHTLASVPDTLNELQYMILDFLLSVKLFLGLCSPPYSLP
ncbi:MAG: hypothetical protein A2843_02675 [Candidatus Wildermuthbacteria bacterium RIFCSPHIGHO2_01_FULL_48_27b]|uniref:Uncharacterized protein n=1 Tax=Candidatus Wildermuthbacteria bacterium RIFCSPHIGHO2_01_FULL_48_27b TaxID=1802447 RepID=A0A1G2QX12_9BACT|nr:MAG: hypothetical protein A2843_02675 [Candidatus Wildermuthbacteria bacterium RIFCSPHIGHO2_01_FULL_48_27b]